MSLKPMYKLCAVATVALLVLGFLVGTPSAGAASRVECATSKEVKKKTPVLMVHGLNADMSMWGVDNTAGSMYKSLGGSDAIFRDRFDYGQDANKWVTNDHIGLELAKHIDCLAKASREGGGNGKVIVVAHSMGGLATRYASGMAIDGRKVSDELGLVVMIGTPNLGSWGGNACNITTWVTQNLSWCEGEAPKAMAVYGDEIKALPHFPSGVAVKTIAGSVTAVNSLFWAIVTVAAKSDLLVPVSSALAGATDSGKGGGKEIVECLGIVPIPGLSRAPCEHGKLPNNPKVQAAVKSSIQAYLKSLEPKVKFTGKLVLDGLQIPTSSNWEVRGISDYPEGKEGAVFDMTTCKRTSEGDYWKDCARFFVNLGSPLRGGGGIEWWVDLCPGIKLVEKNAKVGGLAANIYKVTKCSGDFELSSSLHLWHIPGKGMIEVELSSKGREMKGMREAFAGATWK